MRPPQLLWTDIDDAKAKSMWDDGASLQVIGEALDPPRSRNAVAGRVRRLGFPPHVTLLARSFERKPKKPPAETWRPKRLRPAPRKARDWQEIQPASKQPSQPRTAARGPVPFLEARGCRFPLWRDDSLPSQRFVCGVAVEHAPYCVEHYRIAYQRMPSREDRVVREFKFDSLLDRGVQPARPIKVRA